MSALPVRTDPTDTLDALTDAHRFLTYRLPKQRPALIKRHYRLFDSHGVCFSQKVFHTACVVPGEQWEWIAQEYADEFSSKYLRLQPEDIDLIETDGGDVITAKGEVVGRVAVEIGQ